MTNLNKLTCFVDSYEPNGEPLILNKAETVTDVKKFLKTHLTIVRANPDSPATIPYWRRLIIAYNILSNEKI